jgi:hypothetical protein
MPVPLPPSLIAPTFDPIEQLRVRPTSLHDRELRSGQPEEGYYEVRRNSRAESSEKEEHPDKRERREKVDRREANILCQVLLLLKSLGGMIEMTGSLWT